MRPLRAAPRFGPAVTWATCAMGLWGVPAAARDVAPFLGGGAAVGLPGCSKPGVFQHHHPLEPLETNDVVVCCFIDFRKRSTWGERVHNFAKFDA